MSRMNDQFKNVLPQTELQETSDIIAKRSLTAFQPKTSFEKLLEAFSPNTQNNFLNMRSEVSIITPSPKLPGLDDTVVLEPRTTPLGIGAAFDAAFDNNLSSTLIGSLVSRGYGLSGEPVNVDEFFRAKEKELKASPEGRYVWYNNYLRGEYNQMDTDLRLLTAINNDIARFNNNKVLSDKSWYNPAVIAGGLADPIAIVPGVAGAEVAVQLGATATKGALGIGAGLLRTEAGMLAYGLTRETVLQSVDPDRTVNESVDAIATDLVVGAALYGIPVVAYKGVKRIWGPKEPPAAGTTATPEAPTPGPTTPESPVAKAVNDSVPPPSTVEILTQPDQVTPAQKSQYSQKVDSYQQTVEEISPGYADRLVVSDFYQPESYSRTIARRAVRFEEEIKANEPGLPQSAVEGRALEMAVNSMEVDPPVPFTESNNIVAEERVYRGTNQADFIDRESSSGGLAGEVPPVQPLPEPINIPESTKRVIDIDYGDPRLGLDPDTVADINNAIAKMRRGEEVVLTPEDFIPQDKLLVVEQMKAEIVKNNPDIFGQVTITPDDLSRIRAEARDYMNQNWRDTFDSEIKIMKNAFDDSFEGSETATGGKSYFGNMLTEAQELKNIFPDSDLPMNFLSLYDIYVKQTPRIRTAREANNRLTEFVTNFENLANDYKARLNDSLSPEGFTSREARFIQALEDRASLLRDAYNNWIDQYEVFSAIRPKLRRNAVQRSFEDNIDWLRVGIYDKYIAEQAARRAQPRASANLPPTGGENLGEAVRRMVEGEGPAKPPVAESGGGGGQKPPQAPRVAGGAEEPNQPGEKPQSGQRQIVRQGDIPTAADIEAVLRGEIPPGVERYTVETNGAQAGQVFEGPLPAGQTINAPGFSVGEIFRTFAGGFFTKLFRGRGLRTSIEEGFEALLERFMFRDGHSAFIRFVTDKSNNFVRTGAEATAKRTGAKVDFRQWQPDQVARGLSKFIVNSIGWTGIGIAAYKARSIAQWLLGSNEQFKALGLPADSLANIEAFRNLIVNEDFQADLSSALENIVKNSSGYPVMQDIKALLKDKANVDRAEWNLRALNALQKYHIHKTIQEENLDSSVEAIQDQFEAAFEPLKEEISIFGDRYRTFVDLSKENEELLKDLPNIVQISARLAINNQRTKGFGNTIAAFDSNVRSLFPQASGIWDKLASPLLYNLQSIDNRYLVDLNGEGSDYLAGLVVVTVADSIAANIRGSNMLDFSAANDIISTKMYGKIEETKSNDQEKLVYGTNYAPNTGRAIVNHIGLNSELNAGINANNVNALWSSLMLDDLYAFRQLHSAFVNKMSLELSRSLLNTTSTEGFLTDRLSPLLPSGYTPR